MQMLLMILTMLTINITRVVYLTESARFNLAFSDVLVPILGIVLLFKLRKHTFKSVFRHYPVLIGLLLWIAAVGTLAIYTRGIEDAGWMGLAEELIKTVIVVAYFWIGYNTLRMIRLDFWQGSWVVSALVFILGGFYIFTMAKQGVFLMGDDPKYAYYFMGTDTDPNHAASFLTLSFFGMGAFAWMTEKKWLKTIFYITMAASVTALFITGSRGGMLGLLAGLVFLVTGMFKKNWRFATAIVLTIVLLLFAAIVVDLTWFETHFAGRVINKFIRFDDGLDIRTGLGRTALMMGMDHPFFGVGRGNYILNSLPYFEAINQDFFDDIPHNTYTGLFAETGFIGMLLFLSPVFFLLTAANKRRKSHPEWFKAKMVLWIWIIGGLISLAVQSAVLNVENRRFLWYLAGVMLYYIETDQTMPPILDGQTSRKWLRWINILLIASVVWTGAYLYKNAYISAPRITMESSQSVELPYFESNPGDSVTFNYLLSLGQNELRKPRLMVTVYEVDRSGKEIVLDRYEYIGASGSIKRTFYPSKKNSSFYVRFTRLDARLERFYVTPKSLVCNDQALSLDKWHYLQPKALERFTYDWYWTNAEENAVKTDFAEAVGRTFGERLSVSAIDAEPDDQGFPVISITLDILKDFTYDYVFWAYGYPDNLHLMAENRIPSGVEGYGLLEPIVTSEWKAGDQVTLTYKIPHKDGSFRLACGFYTRIDGNVERLFLEDGKTHALQLGWINTDSY